MFLTKIRALSLLKFSKISLNEIDDALLAMDSGSELVASGCIRKGRENCRWYIYEALHFRQMPNASDANIIYYVSGYLARSIIRTTKCENCREILVNPDGELKHIQLDEELDYQANTFFNMINRGGLARPSDFTFMLTIHCWRVYEEIKSSKEIMSSFLKIQCQRTLFSKIMERAVSHVSLDNMFACSSMCTNIKDMTCETCWSGNFSIV